MTEKEERELEARLPEAERWEALTFANDFIFGKVARHPDVYPELFRRILPHIDADEIELVETQKTIDEAFDSGGVRLDLFARTKQGEELDAEMQAANRGDLPKRSWYDHAMLALQQMSRPRPPGVKRSYHQLRPQYVIFICTFDPFGMGQYVYTFTERCHEVPSLELDDGKTTLFLNAKGKGEISPELKSFLDYVASGRPTGDDPFISRIDELVAEAKLSAEWRREYMTLNMEYALKYDEGVDAGVILGRIEGLKEGRSEGLKEGRKEGLKEGRSEGLKEGRSEGLKEGRSEAQRSIMARLIAGGMDPSEAARYTDLSD